MPMKIRPSSSATANRLPSLSITPSATLARAIPTVTTVADTMVETARAALAISAALAVSTIVSATVVTVGIARANVADGVIDNEGSLFAVALLLGLIFIGIGSFTLLPPRGRRHRH